MRSKLHIKLYFICESAAAIGKMMCYAPSGAPGVLVIDAETEEMHSIPCAALDVGSGKYSSDRTGVPESGTARV